MKNRLKAATLIASAISLSTLTTNAQVTDTGNQVGIGNATPTHKLDVNGDINLSTGNVLRIGGNQVFSTSGLKNMFLGDGTGTNLTTASYNAAIGFKAGEQLTTGQFNTLIGFKAGQNMSTASSNTIIGKDAGKNNSGNQNVLIGREAGINNNGGENTVIGDKAGLGITTGSSNTLIGKSANVGVGTLTNATAIGAGATVNSSNSVILGNAANVGVGTSTPSHKLDVVGNINFTGSLYKNGSLYTGADGATGPIGPAGTNGANGAAGATGPQGPVGPTGGALWTESGSNMYFNTGNLGVGTTANGSNRMIVNGVGSSTSPVVDINVSYTGNSHVTALDLNSSPATGYGYGLRSTGGLKGVYAANPGGSATGSTYAIDAYSTGTAGVRYGVYSRAVNTGGSQSIGVYGYGEGAGFNFGLRGIAQGTAGSECRAVQGEAFGGSTNWAGYFGSGNVYIQNKLGIGTTSPTKELDVNGDVQVTGDINITGELLRNGLLFRSTAIEDGDKDTKIQCNQNGDDDLIRFDLAGTEQWIMRGAALECYNNGESVFIGQGSGRVDDLSTNRNMFVGHQSGYYNTTGSNNTASGYQSLFTNTGGTSNTANGYQAIFATTSGSRNTASGYQALFANINGNDNTAGGYQSLYNNISASGNTAYGKSTLYSNNSGLNNSAFGVSALEDNNSGYDNVGVGKIALSNNTNGYSNTAVGVSAFTTGTSYHNSTAIGFDAEPNAHNTARIGNSSVSSIGGYANWTNVSDGRFKINVEENVEGLEFIKKLRPVTYNLDMDAIAEFNNTSEKERFSEDEKLKAEELQIGFIAQEVEAAAKELGFNFHGVDAPKNEDSHYGLRYAEFVIPLVKAVQELDEKLAKSDVTEIDELRKELADTQEQLQLKEDRIGSLEIQNEKLQRTMEEVLNRLDAFDNDLQQCCTSWTEDGGSQVIQSDSEESLINSPVLEQNQPNPFRENSTIKYYLPQSTINAQLVISDLNGIVLKTFNLEGKGFGQILISGGSFSAGTYIYTLTINGKKVDSKRMMLL